MTRTNTLSAAALVSVLLASGCSTVDQYPAMGAVDLDPSARGIVSGVGLEGHDVVGMTDQMMRDMLATPELAGRSFPPRVAIGSEGFTNESSQRIDKNLIVNRLRVSLNRAAKGRMTFVGRNDGWRMRDPANDNSARFSRAVIGQEPTSADFVLEGSINSLTGRSGRTGMVQQYSQVTFEMKDLETGTLVWAGIYEIQRAAADDIVYR